MQCSGLPALGEVDRAAPVPGERERGHLRDRGREDDHGHRVPDAASSNIMQYHVWVDQGAGAIRLSSTTRRILDGRRARLRAVRGPVAVQLLARTLGCAQIGTWNGPDDPARDLGRRAEGRGGGQQPQRLVYAQLLLLPTATRPTGTTARRTSTPTPRAAAGTWGNGLRRRLRDRARGHREHLRPGELGSHRLPVAVRGAGVHRGPQRAGVLGRLLVLLRVPERHRLPLLPAAAPTTWGASTATSSPTPRPPTATACSRRATGGGT